MCRSASPGAPPAWAGSANGWSPRPHCRPAASCWSIRALPWRPPMCSARARGALVSPAVLPPAGPMSRRWRPTSRGLRNDLEPAAVSLQPVIADALAALAEAPGCLLARMSGSGATCFGLFADVGAAERVVSHTETDWLVELGRFAAAGLTRGFTSRGTRPIHAPPASMGRSQGVRQRILVEITDQIVQLLQPIMP